jgi:hypothetical protein
MNTQNAMILAHLREGHEITPLEALEKFGCLRLAARISDLRATGQSIGVRIHNAPNGKRFAAYRLCASTQGEVMQ